MSPFVAIGALCGAVLLVNPAAARAQAPAPASTGQLELQLGVGRRDEALTSGAVRTTADGMALSDAQLTGAWYGRRHSGLAARLALERYALASVDGSPAPTRVDVTGFEAGGAFALRGFAAQGRLVLEGRVGYSFVQMPVALVSRSTAGLLQLESGSLRAHGPTAGATLALATAGQRLGIELGAHALPHTFGARYDGVAVTPRRFSGRVTATLGRLDAGGARWAGVVLADLSRGSAAGDGVSVRQTRAEIGVGLRASWYPAPPPPAPAPPRLRITVREKVEGPRPGELAAAGPLAGIQIRLGSGRALTTDVNGTAVLQGLPAGPLQLHLTGDGFETSEEVVAFPAQGEAVAELLVARAGIERPSAISGLVRSEAGEPLAARVSILELGMEVTADAKGSFRFDVPPGSYTLSIEAEGFLSQQKQVQAGSDEQRIYNVDLQRESR